MASPNPQPKLDARDWLNPYLSPRRQWVCQWLADRVPHSGMPPVPRKNDPGPPHVFVASKGNKAAIFTEMTGYTQSDLVKKWTDEGFRATTEAEKKGNDLKYKGKEFVRITGAGPGTTSCEALINKLFQKIEQNGFGKRPAKLEDQATSFNLLGLEKNGIGGGKVRGWHWFSKRTESPQPGDFFQAGVRRANNPEQWTLRHVGVITGYVEGENPSWETVEAGQGGTALGYDYILRKAWRPVTPVDPNEPTKLLMGWLDIDEYFGG